MIMRRLINSLCIVFLCCYTATALAFTLEITEKELQEKVSAMMPIELKKMSFTATLSNPEIDLSNELDELHVITDIKITTKNGQEFFGNIKAKGSLFYNADTYGFYMRNVRLLDLSMERLPADYYAVTKTIVGILLVGVFSKYPVYVLKDQGLKNSMARSFLKSVRVEGKKLILTLELFSG